MLYFEPFYPPLPQYGFVDFNVSPTCTVQPAVLSTIPASITLTTNPVGFGYEGSFYQCSGTYNLTIASGSFAYATCSGQFYSPVSTITSMITDMAGTLNPTAVSGNMMTNNITNNCTTTPFVQSTANPQLSVSIACALPYGGGNLNIIQIGTPVECTQENAAVYIADVVDIWVCSVNVTSGLLSNCVITGTGYLNPSDIAFTSTGNAYIVSENTNVILCNINPVNGTLVNCQSAGGVNGEGIAVNNSYAYISNVSGTVTWCTINSSRTLSNCTTTGGSTPFSYPEDIVLNAANTYAYVADVEAGTVWQCPINQSNGSLGTCTGTGTANSPAGISFNKAQTLAYITNYFGGPYVTTCTVNTNGTFTGCVSTATSYSGTTPIGIAVNSSSTFAYVGDFSTQQVNVCTVSGTALSSCTLTGTSPTGSVVDFVHVQGIAIYPNF